MKTNDLKIGFPATLTGDLSLQGKECFKGIQLWFKEAEEKGGISVGSTDLKIIPKLFYYDDNSNPEKTKNNTKLLIEKDKVDLLIGPYSSSLTLSCIEAASTFEKVVWNQGGSSDEIHKTGYKKIVSSITEAGRYFRGIIDLIISLENHNAKISIVRKKDSSFSAHVSNGANSYAENQNLSTKLFEFKGGATSFTEIIAEIKNYKSDFIFCVGSATDDISFCKALINSPEIKYKFTATLAASINEFKLQLAKDSEYFVATSQWEPSLKFDVIFGPNSEEFSNNFKKEFGYFPDYTAAQSYNMCIILEKLVQTVGVDESDMLNEALKSKFTTFYGSFEVENETGKQIGHEMIVVQWQEGEKKIIYPPDKANSFFLSA